MSATPDTNWKDDEIIFSQMSPDTVFVFDRMTEATLQAVAAAPGERILDVACGRAKDAQSLAQKGAFLFGLEASSVMLTRALELLGPDREKVKLVRGLAEALPFPDQSFDKVVCKGAMDHFADIQKSMREIARVTKPNGRIVIAIANFESLTCRLGRFLWRIRHKLFHTPLPSQPFWKPPADHNFKFDLPTLRNLMTPHCHGLTVSGLSLLWGFPGWGALLQKLPRPVAHALLVALDFLARQAPALSDVMIAVASPRKPVPRENG